MHDEDQRWKKINVEINLVSRRLMMKKLMIAEEGFQWFESDCFQHSFSYRFNHSAIPRECD
jgi:hypothetical protein